jgi:hypothetical protein
MGGFTPFIFQKFAPCRMLHCPGFNILKKMSIIFPKKGMWYSLKNTFCAEGIAVKMDADIAHMALTPGPDALKNQHIEHRPGSFPERNH